MTRIAITAALLAGALTGQAHTGQAPADLESLRAQGDQPAMLALAERWRKSASGDPAAQLVLAQIQGSYGPAFDREAALRGLTHFLAASSQDPALTKQRQVAQQQLAELRAGRPLLAYADRTKVERELRVTVERLERLAVRQQDLARQIPKWRQEVTELRRLLQGEGRRGKRAVAVDPDGVRDRIAQRERWLRDAKKEQATLEREQRELSTRRDRFAAHLRASGSAQFPPASRTSPVRGA